MSAFDREAAALFGEWIEPNPYQPGAAEAWVLPQCVSVWAVIGQLKLDYRKAELVAAQYELPLEAVQTAAAYYAWHQEEIDARITANRSFFRA